MKHLRRACSWPCQSPWEQCSVHLWWWEWVPRAFPSSPTWRELGRIHLSDKFMTQTGLQGLKPAVWAVLIQIHRKWWWWLNQAAPSKFVCIKHSRNLHGGSWAPSGHPRSCSPTPLLPLSSFQEAPSNWVCELQKGQLKRHEKKFQCSKKANTERTYLITSKKWVKENEPQEIHYYLNVHISI